MNFEDLYFIAKKIHNRSEDRLREEIYYLCILLKEAKGHRTPEWYEAVEKVLERNHLL
jgi:hypothetical protein